MPLSKPNQVSPPVFYPEADYPIVKYMDLTKFVSLLQRKSLFFCRVDKLEDQFEGTSSKLNFEQMVRWNERLRDEAFFESPPSDEEIEQSVREY